MSDSSRSHALSSSRDGLNSLWRETLQYLLGRRWKMERGPGTAVREFAAAIPACGLRLVLPSYSQAPVGCTAKKTSSILSTDDCDYSIISQLRYDLHRLCISCHFPCIHLLPRHGVRPAWLQIPSLQLTFNFPVLWLIFTIISPSHRACSIQDS